MAEKVTINSVCFDGKELEYAVFGNGEKPLVMIPGISIKRVLLSAQSVAAAYSGYIDSHTVYLFDRPKDVPQDYTVDDMSQELMRALDILNITDADFFGTSQGGMMAQYIAINRPDLLRRLVLASTSSRPGECSEGVITNWIKLALDRDVESLCTEFVNDLYSEAFAKRFSRLVVNMHSDCTEQELDRFVALAKAGENFDVYDDLEKIKCPTLVLGAKNDKVLTGQASLDIAQKIGADVYMYGEPYGHAVYDEARDFKKRIFSFLNNN